MRIAYFGIVKKCGNSYVVKIDRFTRMIAEVEENDIVRIEIEKMNSKEECEKYVNLHAYNAARQDPEARDKGIHQEE